MLKYVSTKLVHTYLPGDTDDLIRVLYITLLILSDTGVHYRSERNFKTVWYTGFNRKFFVEATETDTAGDVGPGINGS